MHDRKTLKPYPHEELSSAQAVNTAMDVRTGRLHCVEGRGGRGRQNLGTVTSNWQRQSAFQTSVLAWQGCGTMVSSGCCGGHQRVLPQQLRASRAHRLGRHLFRVLNHSLHLCASPGRDAKPHKNPESTTWRARLGRLTPSQKQSAQSVHAEKGLAAGKRVRRGAVPVPGEDFPLGSTVDPDPGKRKAFGANVLI